LVEKLDRERGRRLSLDRDLKNASDGIAKKYLSEEIQLVVALTVEKIEHKSYQIYRVGPVFTNLGDVISKINQLRMEVPPILQKPNSMNNFGLILPDKVFSYFNSKIRKWAQEQQFPTLTPRCSWDEIDSQKVFCVQYGPSMDKSLGWHFDDSELTMSICLDNSGDENGQLLLEDGTMINQMKNYAILHDSLLIHSAGISKNNRLNLICWFRSSKVRKSHCPMCNGQPEELVPSNFDTGGGFLK